MAKLILFIATSIDGFIAAENGDVAWLEDFQRPEEDYGTAAFINGVGSIILGSKTYEKHIEFNHWYASHINGYVFTSRQLPVLEGQPIQFVNGDPAALAEKLRQEQKDIWLEGGAALLADCLNKNLVDEMIVTVVPKLLGRGIPLWNGAVNDISRWQLIASKSFTDSVVQLHYAKA